MDRFVSGSIELSEAVRSGDFSRADLMFYGVSHRGNSFHARVFFDGSDAESATQADREEGHVGSFTILGHGGCVGSDESHCDPQAEPDDPFDTRPPHPLAPQTKFVEVTDALKAHDSDELVITVLPVVAGDDGPALSDELTVDLVVRLLVYGD